MTRKRIDKTIRSLAMSRGFYGRLIAGHYGDYEEILDALTDANPHDEVDLVLMLEG